MRNEPVMPMRMQMRLNRALAWLIVLPCIALGRAGDAAPQATESLGTDGQLVLSRATYLDRAKAIWIGQMIGQWTGLQFEHKVASALGNTPFRALPGYAPIDDDYYYEMVAIRAFEKYGIDLTVEELGKQWLENNAGSWGSSEQALLLLKRGVKPPDTGSPRFNKLWWTIGPQFSSDVYGTLNPGIPNQAAALARRLGHINGYAEGTDGAVFVAGMISLGFVEPDPKEIVRKAAQLISRLSPYRQCLDMVISMAEAGRTPQEIFRAIDERWGIEYPATNNAVVNGGIVATSVWFGKGDFAATENLAFSAADFSDTDCNAANAASVIGAMKGMSAFPPDLVASMNDRIYGATMGPLKLTPPVDESISDLARRTAVIGEKILLSHGARLHGEDLIIPREQPGTQEAELFKLSELTQWWNPDWTLERAGFGGAGGGIGGIRGNTYLDGETLSIWPRDEVRGALLRRSVHLGNTPVLSFDVGVDAGCAWHLSVFVNNDRLLDRIIEGSPITQPAAPSERHWEHIRLDLGPYKNEPVVLRLYDLVLVPHRYAGNSYWRGIALE
jgi:hypothetical protein